MELLILLSLGWGIVVCVIPTFILFEVYHWIRKESEIKYPLIKGLSFSLVLGGIVNYWQLKTASGESAFGAVAMAPFIVIGFLIGGLLIALLYKRRSRPFVYRKKDICSVHLSRAQKVNRANKGLRKTKILTMMKWNLIIAFPIAILFSFLHDFILFDYSPPGAIIRQRDKSTQYIIVTKDGKTPTAVDTKSISVFERTKFILNRYKHISTWYDKLKIFALNFFAILSGCLIISTKFKPREVMNTS